MAWIEAQNKTVMENVGLVDMGFMITGGYNSVRTRAFAVTSDLSATEGIGRFFLFMYMLEKFFAGSML